MKDGDSLASYVVLQPYDQIGKLNPSFLRKLVKQRTLRDTKAELNSKRKEIRLWGSLNRLFSYQAAVKMEKPLDPNVINDFIVHISQPSQNDEPLNSLLQTPFFIFFVTVPT
jgi:hypothetical protein